MNNQPKKYVIYTAMVGGYDEIMQPLVVDDRFDYILFSNDIKEDRVGVWQVRPIAYTNHDNTRICRYVKTHPEELLSDYDASVWMDSNIRILKESFYNRVVELYNNDVQIASINHQGRQCIYEEAFEVLDELCESELIVLNWCHKLRKEKYPVNNGLFETGVMYRINAAKIALLNELWWQCINKYSKRDQLSFNYVLWKLEIVCDYIFPKDINSDNSMDIRRGEHKANFNVKVIRYRYGIPWLIRYYKKNPSEKKRIKQLYFRISGFCFPVTIAFVIGQYYRAKHIVRYYLKRCSH